MTMDSVEVMFDYNYNTTEGRHVTIHRGDVFTLLDKSTDEWWKVKKGDQERFYVPANYVKLVIRSPKIANKGASDSISIHTDIPKYLPMNGHHRTYSNASSNADSLDGQSHGSSLDSKGDSLRRLPSLPKHTDSNEISQNDNINSRMLNLNLHQEAIITPSDGNTSASTPDDDEPVAYANMEIIQEIIAQRKENTSISSTSHPDLETWETHTDNDTGQVYYYNPVTEETTWDSPVIKRRTTGQRNNNKLIPLSPQSKRLSRVTTFRKGWTETISDDGSKVYVHNATGEKWHMAIDAGKEYYYKENSQESLWDLPEMFEEWPSPPNVTNTERSAALSLPSNSNLPTGSKATKEEPAFRVAPPVPILRRASVDVVGLSRTMPFSSQAFTLPASMSLSSLSDNLPGGYTLRNAAQSTNSFDTNKRGYLQAAKVTEGKKKFKKNWSLAYVVANDSDLLIYKDEKAAVSKPDAEFGKPEATIDLKHAIVDWSSKERSNRKNFIEVTSEGGTSYLFQHDDTILIHQWHTVILGKVRKFNLSIPDIPENPTITLTVPEPEGNNNDEGKTSTLGNRRKQHSRRLSKYGGKSVYTLYEDNSEFQSPNALGPAGEITKVSIKEKLRKFLTRRPTQESLEKQGILQAEQVFGSRLQFICDRESTTVPKFVVRCIKTIERKGLDFDGLYRINGNQAHIQKLRFLVDSRDDYNLSDYDINVLTGALKLFFRELKEPLIPFKLYNILSETIRDKDQVRKARTMKMQLATMPTVNLDTLKFLFAHLVRVHEHVKENRMRSQNIAIVFGPTLMWPEKESSAIAVNMMCQNSIVEYILSGFDKLF